MAETAWCKRGWRGDKTQPVLMYHTYDPDTAPIISGLIPVSASVPVLVKRKNGEWVLFCLATKTNDDEGWYTILMIKSLDRGDTWGVPKAIYIHTNWTVNNWINGSCAGEDASGTLHVLFNKTTGVLHGDIQGSLWTMKSVDGGLSWSDPVQLTDANPGGNSFEWIVASPNRMCCIQNGPFAGYMVASYNTKVDSPDAAANNAYVKLAYLAPAAGSTWKVGAIADPNNSANDFSGETAIEEIGPNGRLCINSRFSGSGSNNDKRGIAIVDNPTSGMFVLRLMKTTSGITITNNKTNWSMCTDDDGTLYAVGPTNTKIRGRVGIWYSLTGDRDSDGVPTFRQGAILDYGYSGYSGTIFDPDTKTICTMLEYTIEFSGIGGTARQYTIPIRYNKEFAKSTPATFPIVTRLPFNEKVSGPTSVAGHMGQDHGTHDCRWKGGAGVSFDATGLTFSGAGQGLTLSQVQYSGDLLGGNYSPAKDSFTTEISITMPVGAAAATQYLFYGGTSRHVAFNAAHKLVVTATDGTPITVTSNTVFNDGVEHWIAITYDNTDGKFRIYVDGILDIASATGLNVSTGMVYQTAFMLGSSDTDTNRLPASFHVGQMFCTRGVAKTSGFYSGTPAKPTLASLHSYTPNLSANDPSTIAGLVLRVGDPHMQGGMDYFNGYDVGRMPLVRGHSRQAFRNAVSGVGDWFAPVTGSGARAWIVDYDTTVGYHFRASCDNTAPNTPVAAHLDIASSEKGTGLNFIQNTCLFSILVNKIKFLSWNPTFDNWLIDVGAAGSPGFTYLISNSTKKFAQYIYSTNRRQSGSTFTGQPVIALDTWYSFLICGKGVNQPVSLYVGTYAPNLGGLTWAGPYNSGNSGLTDGNFLATQPLTFLTNNGLNLDCNVRTCGLLMWDNDISATPANLTKLQAWSIEQPANTPVALAAGTASGSPGMSGYLLRG